MSAKPLLITVERIAEADRANVLGTEIGWCWTVTMTDRPDDPDSRFTSGSPTKKAAFSHARDLAAGYGYTPEQIEEKA